ncbi:MAG: sulfurtransferase [Propionibacteriaceae bacterium]|jgi:thiosulfate/3-mercaptopyruvate sulfurtransferase|nr:sulfurtransferase [Propionibacteriaceae bacterium]
MSVFPSPLVRVEELARYAEVGGDEPFPGCLRVIDVRWQLGHPANHGAYKAGHIPGAVWADLDHQLADPPSAAAGRHPLPSLERLNAAAAAWGIHSDTTVVALDGAGNMASARLWWLLGDAGFTAVHLLDGGWPAWLEAGLPVETGETVPPPGQVRLGPAGQQASLGIDEAAAWPERGLLFDARGRERYLGLSEPVDRRPGHIPGAVSAPTGDNLTASGHFRPADEIRRRFTALGAGPETSLAAYCGSGVTACHEVFALRLAGFDAALYPGSWSQWSAADRPAARGAAA